MLIPTHHQLHLATRLQTSKAWMSSSVRYRHRLDLTYQARSPQCLCLCLSLNPALASPARLGLWAPTYSPRKVPCNPELPRDTGVPSRAEAHSPQTSLSLSPLPEKANPVPCPLPQMKRLLSGTRLPLPPTRSGHSPGSLQWRGDSSSGSDGPQGGRCFSTTQPASTALHKTTQLCPSFDLH